MTTRKTTRTHTQGDASRQAILDATLRIAAQRGYVGTTVARVKKASGLPASSLYWHFKDKDALLAAALDHGFARWHEFSPRWDRGTAGGTRGDLSLADSLSTQFRLSTTGLDQEPGFWRMGLMLALETGPAVGSQARTRFLGIRDDAKDILHGWWAQAVPVEHVPVLVRLTMAALDGLFIAHMSGDQEGLPAVVTLLSDGLARVADQLTSGELKPGDDTTRRPGRDRGTSSADPSGRDKLLAAAAEVAAESGYEGTTISRICARAGLPASSLYWHFKDKDDLLGVVVESSFQDWSARQPAWLVPAPGVRWQDELRAHLTVTLGSLQDEPTFLRIGHQLLLLNRADPPVGRERFISVRRRQRLIMAQWYGEALHVPDGLPEQLALLTMVLSEGLFFSDQLDVPTWSPAVMAELLVGVLEGALDPITA